MFAREATTDKPLILRLPANDYQIKNASIEKNCFGHGSWPESSDAAAACVARGSSFIEMRRCLTELLRPCRPISD